MDWALLPLRRYANFSGRARRMEYWMFVLLVVVGAILLSIVDAAFGLEWYTRRAGGVLASIFELAMLVPLLAVSVRRLHDTGRNGWWAVTSIVLLSLSVLAIEVDAALVSVLLLVTGIAASIANLVFYCLPGTPGTNRYGLDPKYSPDIDWAE